MNEIPAFSALYNRLTEAGARFAHPLRELPWGQRGFRVYDPDGHIVDISETHGALVRRLFQGGRSIEEIAQQVKAGTLRPEDINEETISRHLNTAAWPDPELLIRTSGEARISNYLLWQIAYAELYFTQKLWPDFRREDLYEAILDFQKRERRFGKTSEQLKSEHA